MELEATPGLCEHRVEGNVHIDIFEEYHLPWKSALLGRKSVSRVAPRV